MFDRPRTSLGIVALLLLLPQTVYVIGDYLAVGIRFPFFRLQVAFQSATGQGNATAGNLTASTITIMRELQFISSGMVGKALGKTAIATYVWLAALGVLILAALLVISWQFLNNPGHARFPGPLILLAGGLFFVWGMVQYGPLLSSSSGYSIPVGLPVFLYIGYQFSKAAKEEGE